MKFALRIYAWVLRLYPRNFQQQHSQAMLETYTDALRDAALHKRLPAFHCHMVLDLISSLPAAHLQGGANMDIWMRRLLIPSSLVIGLIALVQAVYIWSHQTIQLPVVISMTGQALDSRNALWWTLEQTMPSLYTVQRLVLVIWIAAVLALGALKVRYVTLERRWQAAPPFVIALLVTLTIASASLFIHPTSDSLIKMAFTLIFALGWISLALSLRLEPQPRAAPDPSSPRV